MLTQVQYGSGATLSLDVSGDALVADCGQPRGLPLEDTVSAVISALASPLDFPPLSDMVLPEDRVVVALEEGVACVSQLVAGVVSALASAGATPEQIRILRARHDRAISNQGLLERVDRSLRDRIQVVEHEPARRESLSYLAASKDGHPVYINRELGDADVVLPVGALHTHDHVGCLGVHHGWFPAFADLETQHRFHKSQSSLSPKQLLKRREECEEAAWLLGVQMTVQLVPAGNDRAMHVLAGTPRAVWQRGMELAEGTWRFNVARRASLVVAAIGGGPEQQTWQNITRTLSTALEAVEDNGSIAICSSLKTRPGPALRRLAQADSYEAADRAIRRRPTADAPCAARLNRALQCARVYLLSELDENDVETLGVGYVSSAKEIAKLSSQHASCLVLGNAQHIALSLDSEAAPQRA